MEIDRIGVPGGGVLFYVGEKQLRITFWGVRGSRPIPGKDTVIFGGNTPCVTVEAGETLIILDAGTGISNLGDYLMETRGKVEAHLFVTHLHWDHIHGFPFFMPAYSPQSKLYLYGPGKMDRTFVSLMRGQMSYPYFPVLFENLKARIYLKDVAGHERLKIANDLQISTTNNNHPGGCLSYRIDYGDKSCCYFTDTEHYRQVDSNLKKLAEGADVMIYDSNFTDAEYEGFDKFDTKVGWGHSTWQEGIKLARSADVSQLVFFHHATHRTDRQLFQIEKEAQGLFKNCRAAAEGSTIIL